MSKFELNDVDLSLKKDSVPEILTVLEGHIELISAETKVSLRKGESAFISAAINTYQLRGVGKLFKVATEEL